MTAEDDLISGFDAAAAEYTKVLLGRSINADSRTLVGRVVRERDNLATDTGINAVAVVLGHAVLPGCVSVVDLPVIRPDTDDYRSEFVGLEPSVWLSDKRQRSWSKRLADMSRSPTSCGFRMAPDFGATTAARITRRSTSDPDNPDRTQPVEGFNAEITVWCADCHEPMVFHGAALPIGMLNDRPCISPNGLELRVPLRPRSSDPHTGLGMPGFSARIREGQPGTYN